MAPPGEATMPATRRTRKSIGAHTDVRKSMDKENATTDLSSTLAANRKKSRSKSLGPGGLDALKQSTGNRRASLAAPAKLPRSILKPAVAPLPEIPPLKKRGSQGTESTRGSSGSTSDETNGSKVALRTEEEQQAAAREREERERRDARRKSLANRRVSFAAEATLHTFHEVEYQQDSTTSTDSSRRASAAEKSAANDGSFQNYESTSQDQAYGNLSQTNGLQSGQRRSSGLPNFQNRDDDTATTLYSSDSEPADAVEEIATEEEDGSSSDSSDDGTMMSVVTEEVTGTTMGSDRSVDSEAEEESSTLDEALRIAAQRAGTQRLGEDDDGDDGGDTEEEEVIPSFGWIKKGNQQNGGSQNEASAPSAVNQAKRAQSEDGTEMDMDMDMDMTSAVGRIINGSKNQSTEEDDNADEDMSMDVTRVLGGILGQQKPQQDAQPSAEDDTPMDEATMELTTAIGGIRPSPNDDFDDFDDNEDMSMELTTVMGGVLGKQKRKSVGPSRRNTLNQRGEGDDATMDMTTSVGRIISRPAESDHEGEETMGMDITTTIGGIINNGNTNTRNLGKRIMVEEGDQPNSPKKAIEAAVSQGSPKRRPSPSKSPKVAAADENEDPGLWAFRGNGLRRSMGVAASAPREVEPDTRTPSPPKTTTPRSNPPSSKQPASNTRRRSTRSASKSASPEKPSSANSKPATPSSPRGTKRRSSVFHEDPQSGNRTPTVVLTPQQRKPTGVGADRIGLGSPKVAALFERRSSIGETANDFVPGKRTVAFQDPKEMVEEVDRERQREEDKENDRRILEREADGSQEDNDGTFNLREMIDSLSPKRNPARGRKSLHVGSAKGLLGKRPAELDSEDEDDEVQDGVKRLKGHQGSPVKNIRLKNPPSASETTGRLNRASQPSLEQSGRTSTPTLSSPLKSRPDRSPKHGTRFKEVYDEPTTRSVNFSESPVKNTAQLENEADDDRIHLQEFLNMTSIRFMELTTTKRRHTVAPGAFLDDTSADGQDDMSLERCVVAGACTVPTLELYQHSCRELKKYISEGRRIVKEIETDTYEENPPLFREYMSATPDVKALMDNQFKNVKTHARLLSKAMWYEWRMKLQDGLKEGLIRISEGMDSDQKLLQKQQDLLASVMPDVVSRHEALLEECTNLEEVAQELADSDPSELQSARDELSGLDVDLAAKKARIAELRQQYTESEADVDALSAKKQDCLAQIKESEKIREECRGWTSTEINAFRDRVDAIEHEHGWAVTGISGTTLSMTYKREIELVFDIASFQPGQRNSRIDLWYIADNRESDPIPKTAEKEFFVQCLRDYVRALPQNQTAVSQVLRVVSAGWDKARLVSSQISRVNITFPTTMTKTSDSSVVIRTSLMLVPLETRVEIMLNLNGGAASDGIEVSIAPQAKVTYGEHFNVAKVVEFLATRIGDKVGAGEEEWSDVMVELQQRLIARGKK